MYVEFMVASIETKFRKKFSCNRRISACLSQILGLPTCWLFFKKFIYDINLFYASWVQMRPAQGCDSDSTIKCIIHNRHATYRLAQLTILVLTVYVMAQAVRRRSVNAEAQVRYPNSPCEIYGGQRRKGLSTSTLVFPCQYHSTNAAYSFIHLRVLREFFFSRARNCHGKGRIMCDSTRRILRASVVKCLRCTVSIWMWQ
jgi:hypothetical protein